MAAEPMLDPNKVRLSMLLAFKLAALIPLAVHFSPVVMLSK